MGELKDVEAAKLYYEARDELAAAQYRKIAIDYNRRQANLFEAEKVGPPGYPKQAPTLTQMQAKVCP